MPATATAPAPTVTDGGEKKRKGPAPRSIWGDRDEKGKLREKVKGKDIPGFDPKKHFPLKVQDFENPADYFELTADTLERKAAKLREKAKQERELGSVADRVKARKFKTLAEKFAKLEKELRESGMSEEQIAALISA